MGPCRQEVLIPTFGALAVRTVNILKRVSPDNSLSSCSGAEVLRTAVRAADVVLGLVVEAASLVMPVDVLEALERRGTCS